MGKVMRLSESQARTVEAQGGRKPTHGLVWSVLLVFTLALSLRLAYVISRWSEVPPWHVDALGYHQLAMNLIERGIFSLNSEPPFQPDAIRTPGYPFLVALIYWAVGPRPRAVLVMQAVLDSFTALLAMATARRLTRSRGIAIAAGALYGLCPLAVRYCSELFAETTLAFTITLAFYAYSRALSANLGSQACSALSLGAACALSLLIKPHAVLLPVILGAVLVIKGRHRQAAILAGTVTALLVPWVLRNTLVFGQPMLSLVFRNNMARISAPATLAEARAQQTAPWSPGWEALFHEVTAVAARSNPTLLSTPTDAMTPRQLYQTQADLADAARGVIVAHPLAFAVSHVKGVLRGLRPQEHRYWFAQFSGRTWDSVMPGGMRSCFAAGRLDEVPLLAFFLLACSGSLYLFGWSGMTIGAWRLFSRHAPFLVGAILFAAYVVFLPGPILYERFRVPIQPLVCLLIACASIR